MAGMDGLGRQFNIISVGDTKAFDMSQCSAVALIVTASGASSIAVTAAKTFSGTYDNFTTANGFGQAGYWYQATADDGTAAWTKQTAVWSTNSLTLAGTTGYMSVVHIYGSQMADGYRYLKATCTNGTLIVLPYDLTVQRAPENLKILGS